MRDPSLGAAQGWRRTRPDDLRVLTANLDAAAAAARTAPPPIRTAPTATIPAATVAAGARSSTCRAALLRPRERGPTPPPRKPASRLPRNHAPAVTSMSAMLSWSRAGRTPDFSKKAVQCTEWSRGAIGLPVNVVKTSPLSSQTVPAWSCTARCLSR